MNGRERWKLRKKRRLRTILIAVVLLAAAAAVLARAHNDRFGGYAQLELPENVWAQTRYTDMALYDEGVFCSEDLERMFLW